MKHKIAFALIMGLIATGIITFTLVGLNVGFTEIFLATWFRSWIVAYGIVIPIILLVGPLVQKLVAYLLGKEPVISHKD